MGDGKHTTVKGKGTIAIPTYHGTKLITDSCHSRGAEINKIYKAKFPPTAVAKLLQYSGSRIEQRDGFSSYQMIYSRLKMGEFQFGF